MAHDVFRCPHEGCVLTSIESCHPHTEVIGDESEVVGKHCWDEHRCVQSHPEAWTHTDDFELTEFEVGIDCDKRGEIIFFRCLNCRETYSIADGERFDVSKLDELIHGRD